MCLLIAAGAALTWAFAACSGLEGSGDIGAVECYVDEDCALACSAHVAGLDATGYSHTIVGSTCTLIGFGGGGASTYGCDCQTEGGGALPLASSSPWPCLWYGRGRTCIYARDEFAGCDPSVATSCEAPCADLQARMLADAMRPLDAEIRRAGCHEYHCECVLRIEDRCYVNNSFTTYDCATSDEEIIDAYRVPPPPPPPCSVDMTSDAGTGTCVDDGS